MRKLYYYLIYTLLVLIIWWSFRSSKSSGIKKFSLPLRKLGLPRILSMPVTPKRLTAPQFFRLAVSIKGPSRFPFKDFRPPPGVLKAEPLPTFFKYKEGEILPARSQDNCGSCHAFATSGAIADQVALKTGGKIRQFLSPQELLDCAQNPGGDVCGGNDIGNDFLWVSANGLGLDSEDPYLAGPGTCKPGKSRVYISDVSTVTGGPNPADNMKRALVHNGPLCAYMEVYPSLYDYKGKSVYTPASGETSLGGHSIMIYGWSDEGADSKEPGMSGAHWCCKNSWGQTWPDPTNYGWFYLAMGTCSIESYSQTFVVDLPKDQLNPKRNFYASFDEFYSDRNRQNWLGDPSDFGSTPPPAETNPPAVSGSGGVSTSDILFAGALVGGNLAIAKLI